MRARWPSLLLPLVALLCGVCGDDGKPRPGSGDPCAGPLASVLGCSGAAADPLLAASADEATAACAKLVSCGILAAEDFSGSGTECESKADCGTGECMPNQEGALRCHYHRLDLAWCVERINTRRLSRCDDKDPFTTEEVEAIVACITRTPCGTLGLPFAAKQHSPEEGNLDSFVCNDGTTRVFSATVCDHGLLEYR
jgi:hypothetical protein